MKKIIAIILVAVSVLSLSACSQASSPVFSASWGKVNVDETSTYRISVLPAEEEIFDGAPVISGEGTYVSKIYGDYKTGYTVDTELLFDGEITIDGNSQPFTQNITSSVKFTDVTGTLLTPISSEKSYDGITVAFGGDGRFSAESLSYTSSVSYEDGKATTKIVGKDGGEIAEGIATENTISMGKGLVFDNEQIFYVGRALDKSTSQSMSFGMIHPMNNEMVSMSFAVAQETEEDGSNMTINLNGKSQTFQTYTASLMRSGTNTGSPILLVYAKEDTGKATSPAGNIISTDKSRLLKIATQVPYTASMFEYVLVGYSSNVE